MIDAPLNMIMQLAWYFCFWWHALKDWPRNNIRHFLDGDEDAFPQFCSAFKFSFDRTKPHNLTKIDDQVPSRTCKGEGRYNLSHVFYELLFQTGDKNMELIKIFRD